MEHGSSRFSAPLAHPERPRTQQMLTFKTVKELENFKCTGRREELQYELFPDLRARIQPSGERSFAFRYSIGGKRGIKTIPYKIGLAAAHIEAMKAAILVASGVDPCLEAKAKRAAEAARIVAEKAESADLIETVSDRFIQDARLRGLRPATIDQINHVLHNLIAPRFRGRRISQISKAEWYQFFESMAEEGRGVMANRARSWVSALYAFAMAREIVDKNPLVGIKPIVAETPRARLLDGADLAAIWRAAGELRAPHAQFARLLILTGARRNEVAQMTWTEIDLGAKVWTLPAARAKNNRECAIPLSDLAIEILTSLPRNSDFVFSTNARNSINRFYEVKQDLDALLPDLEAWTLHDLRRGYVSGLAQIGVPLHIGELLVNHRSGAIKGVAAVYNRYSYDAEKRSAVEAWSRHVAQLVSGEPADNVVPMRGLI